LSNRNQTKEVMQTKTSIWPASLSDVPPIFTWENHSDLHNALSKAYFSYLEEKFHRRIDRFLQAGVGKDLLDLVSSLSPAALRRIILAPRSCIDLLYAPPSDLVYQLESAKAESCRSQDATAETELWTAMGDQCFVPDQPSDAWSIYDILDRRYPAESASFRAPLIEGGIPIDFSSPHAKDRIQDDTDGFHPLTKAEQASAVAKLDKAMRIIAMACPTAFELIVTYTRVIIVGNNPAKPNMFSSSSTEMYTGRVFIINAHTEATSIDDLVDTLVHEAIHNILYIIEINDPIVPAELQETADPTRIPSPWTGNSLFLHPFCHACFVWLGMWSFWEYMRLNGNHPFSEETLEYRIERSSCGFLKPEMMAALAKAGPHLSDEAKEVMWDFAMKARRKTLPIHKKA
jgi:hypothetical protein